MRVGNDLVSHFGPGAMVMLSLIYALLEWVVDLSHVDEGKKSALEYKEGMFSQYWWNAVEWMELAQVINRKRICDDHTNARDAREAIPDIQRAICHVQLITNEVQKGKTITLINKGHRVKGKKSADDELCSLMLKGKSHER